MKTISSSKYLKDTVLKLEPTQYATILDRFCSSTTLRINHAAMGLVTESAEITDAIKKYMIYGKKLDRTNLIEELGDVMWYAHLLADALDTTIQHAR